MIFLIHVTWTGAKGYNLMSLLFFSALSISSWILPPLLKRYLRQETRYVCLLDMYIVMCCTMKSNFDRGKIILIYIPNKTKSLLTPIYHAAGHLS